MGTTLVLLAAGKGSRFGGLKQLHTFQPQDATLAEFAIWDACKAGFDNFIAIVNEETRTYFEHVLDKMGLSKCSKCIPQTTVTIPLRTKPWGTGHALLSVASAIKTPFVVVNGDDFYGQEAFKLAAQFLNENKHDFALVGYHLKDTLSRNGYVSRGLCSVQNGRVTGIEEHTHIEMMPNNTIVSKNNFEKKLDPHTFVSMNFWILQPSLLNHLENLWTDFFKHLRDPLKDEFFLPEAICTVAAHQNIPIHLLPNSTGHWLGITYAADVEEVQKSLLKQTQMGLYPASGL